VYSTTSQAQCYMQIGGQFDPPLRLRGPAKRTPGKRRIGGCVGPKPGLGIFFSQKTFTKNPNIFPLQLIAQSL